MLTHPTLEKLHQLRLTGMAEAYAQQLALPDIDTLSADERIGLLVDCEFTARDSRRLRTRLRRASCATPRRRDIDYRHARARQIAATRLRPARYATPQLLITGPTGIGKSWLACALANQACRLGFNALYVRLSRFLPELVIARADGRYAKLINTLAKTDLLVLDDFGSARLSEEHRRDLLEILDDRYGARATLVTSQFPIDKWHDLIGDPTLSDAILDRLVHNAYKLALKGDSLRKQRQALTQTGHCDA